MASEYSEPAMVPINPAAFMVVTALGLAVVPDQTVRELTGGIVDPPAAILLFTAAVSTGLTSGQLLLSSDEVAVLHGALAGWRDQLPVGVRDQYDARQAESADLWTKNLNSYREGTR